MKKLIVTIAIVLGMGLTMFAQERFTGADGVAERNGLFNRSAGLFTDNGELYYYDYDEDEYIAYNNQLQLQLFEEDGFFGIGSGFFNRGTMRGNPILPGFGNSDDQGAAPLGSGIAVLTALGAAYLVGKRRKEE